MGIKRIAAELMQYRSLRVVCASPDYLIRRSLVCPLDFDKGETLAFLLLCDLVRRLPDQYPSNNIIPKAIIIVR